MEILFNFFVYALVLASSLAQANAYRFPSVVVSKTVDQGAASALFEVNSTTQGALLPRMTTSQRTSISSPAEGLLVYDTTLHLLYGYENGAWSTLGAVLTAPLFKSSSYTLGTTDDTVIFTAVATATLPTAVGTAGKRYTIINGDTTSVNVTVATTSSQTIGGRSSSNIILAQYNNFLTVESDNSNWQIVDKNEWSFLSNQSSATGAQTTTDEYNSGAASVTVGIGTWQITAYWAVVPSATTTNAQLIDGTGFYAADGTNTTTPPTAISATTAGPTTSGAVFTGFIAWGGGPSTDITPVLTPPLTCTVFVTSGTQAIYAVPQIRFTNFGASLQFKSYIQATRIF